MKHQYHLKELPFSRIKNWTKKIEIRLFDEKRQDIKLLDEIEFSNETLWDLRRWRKTSKKHLQYGYELIKHPCFINS